MLELERALFEIEGPFELEGALLVLKGTLFELKGALLELEGPCLS